MIRGGIGGVVTGIDMAAALKLAEACGYDLRALSELLPAGEAGLLEGMARQRASHD